MTKRKVDLKQLSYFQCVAELGNITAAAAELNITQPTLSKSMQILEDQLGVTLFTREARGVALTPFGQRLLEHAKIVDVQVNSAVDDLDTLRKGEAGSVRIGAGPAWLRSHLPDVVAKVMDERPGISITVIGGFDQQLIQMLASGDVDFVLAETPLSPISKGYSIELLTSDELLVCCRRGHPLIKKKDLALADLAGHWWALPSVETLARKKLDALLLSIGFGALPNVVEASSLAFVLALVRKSDALTYTTTSSLKSAAGREIVALGVPGTKVSRAAGLITRQPSLVSPSVEYVIDRIKEFCAEHSAN